MAGFYSAVDTSRVPELNPAENIWQFLRQTYLSNRIFETYEEILDAACEAWNRLIDQPWRIMSIGLRGDVPVDVAKLR